MRAANLGLILRHLRTHGGRSRARLAAETGLSRATMSSVIGELVDRGLVREGELKREGTVGRPGTTVALDGSHVGAIGVEISVDYLALTTVNLAGEVIAENLLPVAADELDPDEVLDLVASQLGEALARMRGLGMLPVAITVSPPGVIEYDTGAVRFSPNLGWRDVPLVPGLRDRLGEGAPTIHLENDAKLAALAEYAGYASDGVEDLLYLTGDIGVGAGIISGGELVRGWKGFSGEVGHLPLDPQGRPCKCGRNGCWEQIVGLGALLRLCAPGGGDLFDANRPLEERLTLIAQRAASGDPITLDALARITQDLARGLSILNDVLNPRVIVLGGWFTFFGGFILEPLAEELERRRMKNGGRVQLALTRLGMNSAAHGGALMALDDVFNDPTLAPIRG
ncbi:ROK family transcriptional regulator [Luteococcus sp. H138]|uniref:ROK family transcriptional regulator n=1 Tax=unclassified Luteococcus TaxID=2639923 RepID=UPI00313C8BC9